MNNTFLLISVLIAMSIQAMGAPAGEREEVSAALLRTEKDPNSEFMVSVWQAGEGLPVNIIEELAETPDGYLWLGTSQGLVRFDGMRFQSFFTTPTGLRYGARVGPLDVDARGRLWLVPDQVGLVFLHAGMFTEVLTNQTLLKSRAENIRTDGRDGLFWVDTEGGVGRLSTDQPSQAKLFEQRSTRGAKWLRDFQGNMWLTSSRGIKRHDGGRLISLEPASGRPLIATPRREGGLWLAAQGKLQTIEISGGRREIATFPWIGAQTRVTAMLEDDEKRLWIGTSSRGLFCYEAAQFKPVLSTASSILCLLEDGQDNLWAGTRGGGLVRVRQRQFFVHDLRGGLANDFISSLSQDEAGRIWIVSAEGGLGYWHEGLWQKLGQDHGWRGTDPVCVSPTKGGGVWVSTAGRELWRWSDGQFTKQKVEPRALREPAVDLLEDRQGRLWMVTDNSGIFCFEGGAVTRYTEKDGLPSLLMRRVLQDEAGEIWAGDWEGGIVRLQGKRWELVRKSSGHRDAVRSMVSSEGVLWIGTSAGGLLRLKNGQTSRLSVEQGLPDACVQQLLLDGSGSLWGCTPHRLFRLSVLQLNEVMDGRQQQVDAISYSSSDGLPNTSFAAWCDPRCWRTKEGELWFATANGAIHFRPSTLPMAKPPHTVLEQVLLDGKPVQNEVLRHLRPGKGRLEFRFTAPCLTAPERVRFRYQLTGVDPDWMDAGAVRSATYGSIPAGDHVFRVLASSPEGQWGSEPATVALAVHPYFWQTTWFLAALAAATAGGAVWIIRRATVRRLSRRLEHMHQRHLVDKERARIAQDIHDELGANLTSIGLLADMGTRHKSNPAAVSRELGQISETARESVAAMDAIVWALNPRNDSLDHFANYVAQFTRDFFRPTQLRTRLDLPANLPPYPMATETRHHLFLLVKESFNNVVRHAQATEVRLELACDNGDLRLTIADNGKGLPGVVAGEGQDGMSNLHERIQKLGGTLCVTSKPGSGTRLDFALPLARFKPD